MDKKTIVGAVAVFGMVACVVAFGGSVLAYLQSQSLLTQLSMEAGVSSGLGALAYGTLRNRSR